MLYNRGMSMKKYWELLCRYVKEQNSTAQDLILEELDDVWWELDAIDQQEINSSMASAPVDLGVVDVVVNVGDSIAPRIKE